MRAGPLCRGNRLSLRNSFFTVGAFTSGSSRRGLTVQPYLFIAHEPSPRPSPFRKGRGRSSAGSRVHALISDRATQAAENSLSPFRWGEGRGEGRVLLNHYGLSRTMPSWSQFLLLLPAWLAMAWLSKDWFWQHNWISTWLDRRRCAPICSGKPGRIRCWVALHPGSSAAVGGLGFLF